MISTRSGTCTSVPRRSTGQYGLDQAKTVHGWEILETEDREIGKLPSSEIVGEAAESNGS